MSSSRKLKFLWSTISADLSQWTLRRAFRRIFMSLVNESQAVLSNVLEKVGTKRGCQNLESEVDHKVLCIEITFRSIKFKNKRIEHGLKFSRKNAYIQHKRK